MSRQKQVIIDIDSDGNCSIEGEGFIGPECSHFTGEIEEALGEQTSQRNKPEYDQRQIPNERNRQCEGR